MEEKMHAETQKRSTMQKLFRASVYYFIGLSIFFLTGFIIITVRVSMKTKIEVPPMVGKLYLDVHNQLTDLGLKIELKKEYSTEYPYGYILYQSISPGKIIKEGSRITILVNQSKTIIKVPKLTGMKEDLIKNILKNIHVGNRNFFLNLGVVTHIPSTIPKGEVIAQFPQPGTPVVPESNVSILVSSGKKSLSKYLRFPKIDNVPVPIVKEMAYHLKMPVLIDVIKTNQEENHGITVNSETKNLPKVWKDLKKNPGIWKIEGAFFPYEFRKNEGPFKFVMIDPKKNNIPSGVYTTGIIRKETTKDITSQSEKYIHLSYIKITDKPFPAYIFENEQLALWKGYFIPVQEEKELSKVENKEDKDKKKDEKEVSKNKQEKGKLVFDLKDKKQNFNREPDIILNLEYRI